MKFFPLVTVCVALFLSCIGGAAIAGALDGPTKQAETVLEGKTDVYRIRFAGGKRAVVRAKAGNSDVDLFIYDARDTLVASATNAVLSCAWTPGATDEFTIKIVNNEKRDVDYKLETN